MRRIVHRGGRSPKLVLLDLKLPQVDRLEVRSRVKSDPRTRMIPVVVLSYWGNKRDIIESYQLGINSYIANACEP